MRKAEERNYSESDERHAGAGLKQKADQTGLHPSGDTMYYVDVTPVAMIGFHGSLCSNFNRYECL